MKTIILSLAFIALFSWNGSAQGCASYSITLSDSWIGGWEGGYLNVYVNGMINMSNVTIVSSNTDLTVQIYVYQGDIISIDYTAGANSSENMYTVFDETNTLVATEGAGLATPGDIGNYTIPTGLTVENCNCLQASDLSISEITETSVQLHWIENGSAGIWNIEWGPEGFTQGMGTMILGVSDNPYSLTDLSPGTSYDFYVESDCGELNGAWSSSFTFASLIDCPTISELTETNIEETSVDLGWTENGVAEAWEIEWGTTGFTQGTGTMILDIDSNPYLLTGLTEDTTYDYYVRAMCDETIFSPWSSVSTFTTLLSCPTISELTETNIEETSVDIGWTENGVAEAWEIEWGPTGFTQGTGTMIFDIDSNPYLLTGLTEDTTYDYYVRAMCDETTFSPWSNVSTFTTLDDGVGVREQIKDTTTFTVFPNPNSGTFTLTENGLKSNIIEINIFNSQGQIIYTQISFESSNNNKQVINLNSYSSGLYNVVVTTKTGLTTMKLFIE